MMHVTKHFTLPTSADAFPAALARLKEQAADLHQRRKAAMASSTTCEAPTFPSPTGTPWLMRKQITEVYRSLRARGALTRKLSEIIDGYARTTGKPSDEKTVPKLEHQRRKLALALPAHHLTRDALIEAGAALGKPLEDARAVCGQMRRDLEAMPEWPWLDPDALRKWAFGCQVERACQLVEEVVEQHLLDELTAAMELAARGG